MKIIRLAPKLSNLIESGLNYLLQRARTNFRLELGQGKGNPGDTAISQSVSYLLKREFPSSKLLFMNCQKIFTKADIDMINKADMLFVSGGGLFLYSDSFANSVSDWLWGISESLLDKIEIPIVVYAVGYNRFRGQLDFNENFNRTVTLLIKKSLFFSLRNTGSCNAIKKYVPETLHNRILLNYCPTLLFNNKFNFKNYSDNKTVGLVLAGDRLKNRHKDINKFVKHMKAFIKYLRGKGMRIIIINHTDDNWIADHIDFDGAVNLFARDSKSIYKTYSQMDMVIGDRGHAQMIAFACGCKILTPISHDKLKWFLEDMNLEDFGVEEYDDDLSGKLIEKFSLLKRVNWQQIHEERMRIIAETNERNLEFIKDQIYRNINRNH